jgi:hypothetical protein
VRVKSDGLDLVKMLKCCERKLIFCQIYGENISRSDGEFT